MKNIVLFTVTLLFLSCSKDRTDDVYVFEFDFNLENHFLIENSNELLETDKGYIDTNYELVSTLIHLNDGVILDSLTSSCGNWNYKENPSSVVKIWFPQKFIQDGTYQYSRTANINDFWITIQKNMTFGPVYQFGLMTNSNAMLSSEDIAYCSYVNNDPYTIEYAEIKINYTNSSSSIIRYALETTNGEIIKGSYSGNLENFKRINFEGDCD